MSALAGSSLGPGGGLQACLARSCRLESELALQDRVAIRTES